jgi:hypothetical protein
MKLDNREKYEKIRKFLGELKLRKSIEPFMDLEEILSSASTTSCISIKTLLHSPRSKRKSRTPNTMSSLSFLRISSRSLSPSPTTPSWRILYKRPARSLGRD